MNPWQRYRTLILACLLVLACLVILGLSLDRPRSMTAPEKVVIEVLAPFQRGVMGLVHTLADFLRRYVALTETAEENLRLRQELAELRQKLANYQEAYQANQRLRRMLDFKEGSPLPQTAAEVVGLDPSGWYRTILVDKGSAQGVMPGMGVVTGEGVVGRTIEVGRSHSKVLLLTDRTSAVDALVQRTRARGIVKGSPEGLCRLEFVNRNADVKEGDLVITSGLTAVFPKGLIIGVVASVERAAEGQSMFQTILIQPAVNFDRLEEVMIVLLLNPDLQKARHAADN